MSDVATKELPGNWVRGQIKDLVTIRNGYAFKSKDFKDEGGVPVIRQTNLSSRVVNFNKPKYLPIEFLNEFESYKIIKGDVLIGLSGSIGNLSRYLLDDPALQNQRTGLLVEHVLGSIKYVEYYLQLIKGQLLDAAKGVAVQNISSKTIESWNIPIAPPEQQKRIVAKIEELFSHIDAGIEALKKAKQLLKQYRQSVLKAAVTGELTKEWREANKDKLEPASQLLERILKERRKKWEEQQLEQFKAKGKIPKDDKWKEKYKEPIEPKGIGAEQPNTWVRVTWDQVGLSQNGRAFPSKEYSDSGYKLLRPGNLHMSGRVEWTEKNTKKLPHKWADEFPNYIVTGNELVMNLTAQSLADEFLGRICLTEDNETCLLNQRIARLVPIILEAKYLLYLFKSKSFRTFVDGLNTGSLIQHMYTTQLMEFEFQMPPIEEQKEIIKIIEQKLSAIEHIEKTIDEQLAKSEKNKQSILASAFTGGLN